VGVWALGVAGAVLLAGCGKKGPPLAPIVHIPAAVDKVTATRIGNDVYLSVTIPTQNIDTSSPADLTRIDVFGVTMMTPPARARVFEVATKVSSIEVAPAPRPGESAPPAAADATLPTQGMTVVLRDVLTAEALTPKSLTVVTPRRQAPAAVAVTPVAAPPSSLRRYYVAVALYHERQGPPGNLIEVPLTPLPDPPPSPPIVTFPARDAVAIQWEPSGGALGFVLEKPAPPEEPPVETPPLDPAAAAARAAATLPPGPTLYNVYREPAPAAVTAGSPAAPASPPVVAAPVPINPAPIAALSFTDATNIELGTERCYTVRAVRGAGPAQVIGEASPRGCLRLDDHFAPEAPTNLSAAATEGSISLIWDPNGEADLGGYLVLRGRAGDATLQRLTPTPVTDNRYVDRDVMPGVRYEYAVQAVDMQQPPNTSHESNRVDETAR
jgi:hypothetical protein